MEPTASEQDFMDRHFLHGNPPTEPTKDLYQYVLGTIIVSKSGWFMLADRRTGGPVWGHA